MATKTPITKTTVTKTTSVPKPGTKVAVPPKLGVDKKALNAPASPDPKQKVARHVDAKVAARNNALNAMGGVKVDVFVRIRPPQPQESHDPTVVTVSEETPETLFLEDQPGKPATSYTFDKVYGPSSTQEALYEDAVAPIVEQVARGMSCAIFAYGQTGAGKTFTMRGDLSSEAANHGVIQRSIMNLFRRLGEHDYTDIKVKCSFLEIYNEELDDLLAKSSTPTPSSSSSSTNSPALSRKTKPRALNLIDDADRGTVCSGLTEVDVENVDQIMALLNEAETKCKFAETKMNKMSNRAHRIFSIICNFKRYDKDVVTTLTFVDLAGSEDISKSGATGMTAREASHINKSLLTLGRVINALACNEKHIPYRDSKLTRLLSEALGGVCKTSFIACVSPCQSSVTETSSTLRYAERAMEALNISQLPRWKQDEIMIDGLTRRVQMLMDDLANQAKIHDEVVVELRNDKLQLKEEVKTLSNQLWRSKRVNEKLNARKLQLKRGLSVMTAQRDLQMTQKEALQAELLKTRKERDGLQADRASLVAVLSSVRQMREKLLACHRSTESSLTGDATALKRTIEGAIKDVDDLHAEISRKRALSSANESLADDFRDRLSLKLRNLVQNISEFKTSQGDFHSDILNAIVELKSSRQKETGSLRSDVARLATDVNALLDEILKHAKESENSAKSRLSKSRDEAERHHEKVSVKLSGLKTALSQQLDAFRGHAQRLDDTMISWSEAMKAKFLDAIDSSSRFATHVTDHAASLSAHLQSTMSFQLARFGEHSASLEKFLQSERTQVSSESERLTNDLVSYIQRMVSDHASLAIRRTEQAVSGFRAQVDELHQVANESAEHQLSEFKKIQTHSNDWKQGTVSSLEEGKKQNESSHSTAVGLLETLTTNSNETKAKNTAEVQQLEVSQSEYLASLQNAVKESISANMNATAGLEKINNKGAAEIKQTSEAIRERAHTNFTGFSTSVEELNASLGNTLEHVKVSSDEHTDRTFDVEATTVKYVMQEIKRDTQPAPAKKQYQYPTKYATTDAYENILKDSAGDWSREVKVHKGDAAPGKGTDYSDELGADDFSGLLTSTKTRPPSPNDLQNIDDAARESDEEDYVVTGDPPRPEELEEYEDEEYE